MRNRIKTLQIFDFAFAIFVDIFWFQFPENAASEFVPFAFQLFNEIYSLRLYKLLFDISCLGNEIKSLNFLI